MLREIAGLIGTINYFENRGKVHEGYFFNTFWINGLECKITFFIIVLSSLDNFYYFDRNNDDIRKTTERVWYVLPTNKNPNRNRYYVMLSLWERNRIEMSKDSSIPGISFVVGCFPFLNLRLEYLISLRFSSWKDFRFDLFSNSWKYVIWNENGHFGPIMTQHILILFSSFSKNIDAFITYGIWFFFLIYI